MGGSGEDQERGSERGEAAQEEGPLEGWPGPGDAADDQVGGEVRAEDEDSRSAGGEQAAGEEEADQGGQGGLGDWEGQRGLEEEPLGEGEQQEAQSGAQQEGQEDGARDPGRRGCHARKCGGAQGGQGSGNEEEAATPDSGWRQAGEGQGNW